MGTSGVEVEAAAAGASTLAAGAGAEGVAEASGAAVGVVTAGVVPEDAASGSAATNWTRLAVGAPSTKEISFP